MQFILPNYQKIKTIVKNIYLFQSVIDLCVQDLPHDVTYLESGHYVIIIWSFLSAKKFVVTVGSEREKSHQVTAVSLLVF